MERKGSLVSTKSPNGSKGGSFSVQVGAVAKIPDFWTKMASSSKRFLGLDYDGTLAPFRTNRDEAHPLPGIVDLLETIHGNKRTVLSIVSGRPVSELILLLGGLHMIMIGSHGFELRIPGEKLLIMEPGKFQKIGIDQARQLALKHDLGSRIEVKVAGIALHTRGLPPEEAHRTETLITSLWSKIAVEHELRCMPFQGGVELRAEGWNKGDAVIALLRASRTDFNVYVGDDETDEDVFRSLQDIGTGIKVGVPEAPTLAAGRLRDCFAVRDFLKMWCSLDSA